MNNLNNYKLSLLYDISSGISSKPEDSGHGYPFVSFGDVFNNYFLPSKLTNLMNTSVSQRLSCSVEKGDILLTRTSETLDELAMSSVAYKDYPDATFSGFVKRLRPTVFNLDHSITYDKFMGFLLRSSYFRKIIDNNAIMTLRASFNENIFSYIDIKIPNYEYQKKAGDLLFSIEEKIEINNKVNSELEVMAKTIYDYWFIQFDFPDENGKPYKSSGGEMIYNEYLKREIPAGWDSDYLGNICDLYQSKTISDNEMNEAGEFLVYGANGIIGKYDNYNHKDSEIVISCRGSCGDIIRTLPNVWITGNAMVVKPKNKSLHNEFIYQTLKIIGIHKSITGSVQKQITRTNLEKLSMLVPKNIILLKYIDTVKHIVEKKLSNTQEKQELEELKDWLLPMLMNGQVGFKSLEK